MAKFTLISLLTLLTPLALAQGPEIPATTSPCTMTITQSAIPLSTPPYWAECSWDGTQTIWPSTATSYVAIDCQGCASVDVRYEPQVNCPAEIIKATTHATVPTTTTSTVCFTQTVA